MKQLVKEHVPKKNVGGRYHLPWMTSTLRRIYRKKGRLYSKAKKKGARCKEFIEFQRSPQQALKKAHWQYVNRMLSRGLEESAQKPFWRYVRSQRQDNQGVSSLLKGNKLRSDPATTAGILSEQFCSVFTVDKPETANISLEGPSYPPQDLLHVTEAGVHKLLKNLNPGKASGLDEIPTHLLKELADDITPVVTSIIRQTLNQGSPLDVWRDASVIPVFKKGGRSDPANYRPVSLTCIVCKLAEHILCTHIRGHLHDKGILTPANHGFR